MTATILNPGPDRRLSVVYLRFPLHSAAPRERAGLLERLLARATRLPSPGGGTGGNWRIDALRLLLAPGGAPGCGAAPAGPTARYPLAPLALRADAGDVRGAWTMFATPLHCTATMSSVRLPPSGILRLDAAEAAALAGDFARVFGSTRWRLIAGRSGALFAVHDEPLAVHTHDPADALDQDVWPFMPAGAGAATLRRLMSEIELWLFDHEINRARQARALAAITGLWLWDGGVPLAALPTLRGWAAGGDAFFSTLALPAAPPASGGADCIAADAHCASRGVIVVDDPPGTAGWRDAESRWLRPLLLDMRRGRLAAIRLSAGAACLQVEPGWRWRLWRRVRPWWECFET
jgi:hypothetical protein